MRNFLMAGAIAALALPAATPALAQSSQHRDYRQDEREANREYRRDVRDARRDRREDVRDARQDRREAVRDARRDNRQDWRRYDYNRPDPRYGNYRPERYYTQGNYPSRRLSANDRVYRGADNRYYCRRDDGTTGLIVGALGGGALGNIIAPGGSKTLGTILGGGAGALLGRSIDRNNVSCR